jgi:hypothetical protein
MHAAQEQNKRLKIVLLPKSFFIASEKNPASNRLSNKG